MLALLLVLACHQLQPPTRGLDACEDAECRIAWALEQWTESPVQVEMAIADLHDPVERLSLVVAVSEAHPGEARDLCAYLASPTDRSYCDNIHARPHLREQDLPLPEQKPRSFALDDHPVPWPELTGVAAECVEDAGLRRKCQADAAGARSSAGAAREAAALCVGITEEKWREECLFMASEAAIAADHVEASATLCLATTEWRTQCFTHLVRELANLAPEGAPADADAWAPVFAAQAEVAGVLGPGPGSEEAEARIWARTVRRSYATSSQPTGAPLDALPASAEPQVRAAAMARLWELERRPGAERDLAAWVARLDEVLASREPAPPCPRGSELVDHYEPWFEPGVREYPLQTVPWEGFISRVLSADPQVDARILVLEAAMRQPGPGTPGLVEEGLAHPDPMVRWTAVRALGALSPKSPALEPMLEDPDFRVATRASMVRDLRERAGPVQVVEEVPPPGVTPGSARP